MGSGFSKMKKQARLLEQQYEEAREKMQSAEYQGSAGNGLVTITLTGEKIIKDIKIKPECVDPQDIEGLVDLIKAAQLEAINKIQEDESSAKGGLNGMPSFF
jgi:DNA-binding YbaB/EbfC family protein